MATYMLALSHEEKQQHQPTNQIIQEQGQLSMYLAPESDHSCQLPPRRESSKLQLCHNSVISLPARPPGGTAPDSGAAPQKLLPEKLKGPSAFRAFDPSGPVVQPTPARPSARGARRRAPGAGAEDLALPATGDLKDPCVNPKRWEAQQHEDPE